MQGKKSHFLKKVISLDFLVVILYNVGMKKFKYNHSPLVYTLLAVILVATAVGCYFSVYSAIISIDIHKIIAYSFLSAINLFLFITVLIILTCSKYVIKRKQLKIYIGYICTKYPIDDIYSLTELIDVKKLMINFKDGGVIFAVINKEKIENFVAAIKEENAEIVFDINYISPQKKEQ